MHPTLKSRLQRSCFSPKFETFLRTPVSKNICERLRLKCLTRIFFCLFLSLRSGFFKIEMKRKRVCDLMMCFLLSISLLTNTRCVYIAKNNWCILFFCNADFFFLWCYHCRSINYPRLNYGFFFPLQSVFCMNHLPYLCAFIWSQYSVFSSSCFIVMNQFQAICNFPAQNMLINWWY